MLIAIFFAGCACLRFYIGQNNFLKQQKFTFCHFFLCVDFFFIFLGRTMGAPPTFSWARAEIPTRKINSDQFPPASVLGRPWMCRGPPAKYAAFSTFRHITFFAATGPSRVKYPHILLNLADILVVVAWQYVWWITWTNSKHSIFAL